MDTNMIILILAGLVAFGLIYRSVSNKPEKTTGGGFNTICTRSRTVTIA